MTIEHLSIITAVTGALMFTTSVGKKDNMQVHFDNLLKEIQSCQQYFKLHACEKQLERFADQFHNHTNYSSYYRCLVNAIQEKSVLLQVGV